MPGIIGTRIIFTTMINGKITLIFPTFLLWYVSFRSICICIVMVFLALLLTPPALPEQVKCTCRASEHSYALSSRSNYYRNMDLLEILYPMVLIGAQSTTLWNGASLQLGVILVVSNIIIASGDALSRLSATFVLGSGIVGVVAIVFVVVFSILNVVDFVVATMTNLVCQVIYLGVQLGNHNLKLKIFF